jgi:hypothetical protein
VPSASSCPPLSIAKRSITTAILQVSCQVHREAYDVMVKTNRPVLLRSRGQIPLWQILAAANIAVVAAHEGYVAQFQGYVLDITLAHKPNQPGSVDTSELGLMAPLSVMILARDLDKLIQSLMEVETFIPNFGISTLCTAHLAPNLRMSESLPRYKDTISAFFSEQTQEALLLPFSKHMRGFKNFAINGHVLPTLAQSVCQAVAQDEWSEPEHVIKSIQDSKETGAKHYKAGRFQEAHKHWSEALWTMSRRLLPGSACAQLTSRGGNDFMVCVAELFFQMSLNVAQAGLKIWGAEMGTLTEEIIWNIQGPLNMASSSIEVGYWKEDFQWQPSALQHAKLHYRYSHSYRLLGDLDNWQDAVSRIDKARVLCPNDPAIEAERIAILTWATRGLEMAI